MQLLQQLMFVVLDLTQINKLLSSSDGLHYTSLTSA